MLSGYCGEKDCGTGERRGRSGDCYPGLYIHNRSYMQRKNQIRKFMLCFFTGLQGGLDFKLPVSIDTVFDNSPGMQQIFLLVQNLLKERERESGREGVKYYD